MRRGGASARQVGMLGKLRRAGGDVTGGLPRGPRRRGAGSRGGCPTDRARGRLSSRPHGSAAYHACVRPATTIRPHRRHRRPGRRAPRRAPSDPGLPGRRHEPGASCRPRGQPREARHRGPRDARDDAADRFLLDARCRRPPSSRRDLRPRLSELRRAVVRTTGADHRERPHGDDTPARDGPAPVPARPALLRRLERDVRRHRGTPRRRAHAATAAQSLRHRQGGGVLGSAACATRPRHRRVHGHPLQSRKSPPARAVRDAEDRRRGLRGGRRHAAHRRPRGSLGASRLGMGAGVRGGDAPHAPARRARGPRDRDRHDRRARGLRGRGVPQSRARLAASRHAG